MITCAREPAVRPIGAGLGAKADAVAQAAIQSMILMFNVEQSQWWWPPGEEKETDDFCLREDDGTRARRVHGGGRGAAAEAAGAEGEGQARAGRRRRRGGCAQAQVPQLPGASLCSCILGQLARVP